MNTKLIRVNEGSIGDVSAYCMIDYHMDFTEVVNKLLKANNINYKLDSCSHGSTKYENDWRVVFTLKKQEARKNENN